LKINSQPEGGIKNKLKYFNNFDVYENKNSQKKSFKAVLETFSIISESFELPKS